MYRRKGGDLVMHVYYHVCGVVALVEEDVFVFDQRVGHWLGLDELGVHALEDIGQVVVVAGRGTCTSRSRRAGGPQRSDRGGRHIKVAEAMGVALSSALTRA